MIDKDKKINKKYYSTKANLSYTQMLILIISIFAFSYLIYDSTETVSAETSGGGFIPGYGCCAETKTGNTCQYIPIENCAGESLQSPNLCENTVFCTPGCCVSGNTGVCNEATPKISCDKEGGIWSSGSCNIQKCERGCCVLGSQAKFTTEKNCEVESGFLGIPIDFKGNVQTEIECIFLTEKDDEGACVFESGEETTCLYITREECFSRTKNENNFYKDTFCSSPELNTNCASHDYDGCVDKKDEVYWYDSCGNKEDIKQDCSIFTGSICGKYRDGLDSRPNQGEYVCRSLDCKADNGMNYKNGESWCEYEGTVGDGKDVVGSRHVKHLCFMGEERIEPCADYRNQICVGTESNIGNGKTFSEAACRQNNWQKCFAKNMAGESGTEDNNPDCIVKEVDLTDGGDDTFKFSMNVPNSPPGFDIKNNYDSALGLCSFASQTCTVVEVKRIGGWKCEVNCDCKTQKFTQQMNDLCISLGDCGGYVNTEGEYADDGYTTTARNGKVDGNQYKKYAQPEKNLDMIEPGDLDKLFGIYGASAGENSGGMSTLGYASLGVQGVQILGIANTLAGTPILGEIGLSLVGTAAKVAAGNEIVNIIGESTAGQEAAVTAAKKVGVRTAAAGWGNLLSAIGAGLAIATILSLGFGVDEGDALTIGLGIGGALLIAANYGFLGISWGFVQLLGWIGLIIIIIMWIAGIGDTRERNISFKCLPWQPPAGGDDCEKCNPKNEFDVPCSEYKCNSLGQGCELINPGTKDEKCTNICQGGFSSPRISPVLNSISKGYDYKEVSDSGFAIKTDSGKCINEYTQVEYEIRTNKESQCKIGADLMQTYDEMPEFFGEKNSYTLNHSNVIVMPSIAAFKNQYNLTQEQIESLGDIKFYVKCKEACNGLVNEIPYTIKTCVNPGPDITAPVIQKISPDSGAFVKYGETTKNINLWINEPANCRWDITDIDYNNMANEMSCQTGINKYQLYGWPCNTTLTKINTNNKFYIRCKDQPWLAETNTSRNKMSQSRPYELRTSNSPLSIIDFKPENNYEFIKGTEPAEINLNVRTSGGAENGKAICEWKLGDFSFDRLKETGSDYHSGVWNTGFRGEHVIEYYCEDVAKNNASALTSFKIKVDTTGPKIIRVYFDNSLKIITDEEAECRYGFNRNFKFENATEMNGDGFEHFADWQLKTYYVQCEDQFKRKGGKTIVKAYDLL
jgi:hypothetical protein